jgi:large conductance mechanosensitive channel
MAVPAPPRKGLLASFREFLLRGNVVDLAIAVVIGGAFGTVIKAFVTDMITPLVSIFSKHTNFEDLAVHIRGATFAYGDFINAAIAFVIIAAVVFFFVVSPIQYLMDRRKKEEEAEVDEQVVLLTQIRDLLASNRG